MNRQPSRISVRTVIFRAAAIVGLLAATFGVATSASAHNVLISTSPADGSTVATVPSTVTLTFNLPALAIGSVLQVVGPGGNVAVGPPTLIDHFVHQAVRPGAPAGAYTVEWRVTSIDGHPISGEFRFTATAANGASGAAAPTDGATPIAAAGQPTSAAVLPQDSSGSGGSAKALIVLLAVAALGIIAAGIYLVVRHPGAPPEDDPDSTDPDEEEDATPQPLS